MNSTTLRLKPLALILATAFPLFAHAAPTVSASGYYQFSGYDGNPENIVNLSDNFAQNATAGAFAQSKHGATNPYGDWISSNISAASDGTGHFGSAVENNFTFTSGLNLKAGTMVTLTDTITNNTGSAQNINFNFNIDRLSISTFKGIQMDISPMVNTASFAAYIQVNGSTVWNTGFSTEQTNSQTVAWQQTGSSIGLDSLPVDPLCSTGDFYTCGFSIQNYTNSLSLGSLAANASLTVSYTVRLDTETNSYGGSSSIIFSDPAGISAGNAFGAPLTASLQFAAPVPEPEQTSMLLAGLALVGVAAKRRRKSR